MLLDEWAEVSRRASNRRESMYGRISFTHLNT